MTGITSIGGVYLRSPDPAALAAWYRDCLGLTSAEDPSTGGRYRDFYHVDPLDHEREWRTVWAIVPGEESVSGPDGSSDPDRSGPLITYRVDDIEATVGRLLEREIEVEDIEELAYGRFARVRDPDGNALRLWED